MIETCKCFGDTGVQASTHGGGDGRRYCDMCGSPVDDGADEMVRAIAEHIDAFADQVLQDYGIAREIINADPEIMGNAMDVARNILLLVRHAR